MHRKHAHAFYAQFLNYTMPIERKLAAIMFTDIAGFWPAPPKLYQVLSQQLWKMKGIEHMTRKRYTPEQIIRKLREAEVMISQGKSISQATRQIGIVDQTYYKWRREYGGMRVDQAKRLKHLEKQNLQLKKIVADKELDIQVLKETLNLESKNF